MIAVQNVARPAGFPPNIVISQLSFTNWDRTIDVPNVWTCTPATGEEVAAACNWAAQNGYTVRPRGSMHSWSPFSVTPLSPTKPNLHAYDKVLLVDTKGLHSMSFMQAGDSNYGVPAVKVGVGATMESLMEFLELQPGGKGAATGYSFSNIPAPGSLTVGGVLAINGHGTSVPTPPNDAFATTYGSMSNRILSLTAVVTDPGSADPNVYRLKTFERSDKDISAFMTQLGRAFLVEATLQVIDNFNMRCLSITDLDSATLFAKPTDGKIPPKSVSDFLNQSGRIEIIWFPFTANPWLKVWTVVAEKPASSRHVYKSNNYPFSDNLADYMTDFLKAIFKLPGITVSMCNTMQSVSNFGLDGKNFAGISGTYPVSRDIWGASKNTMLYVGDTTLRVTANGYAVLMNKSNVQQAIADFTLQFQTLLNRYRDNSEYPVNSPLEIRVTGLDRAEDIPLANGKPATRPAISGIATDAETEKNNFDVALWLDILSLPGTDYLPSFYHTMESWLFSHFTAPTSKIMVEWSKGWAYSYPGSAWTKTPIIDKVHQGFTSGRNADDNWSWQVATMAKYDAHNIFQSDLTKQLFV